MAPGGGDVVPGSTVLFSLHILLHLCPPLVSMATQHPSVSPFSGGGPEA